MPDESILRLLIGFVPFQVSRFAVGCPIYPCYDPFFVDHPTFGVKNNTREYLRSDAVARLCRFHQKEQRIARINETRRSPTDQREVIDIIVLRLPI